jgi:hypothetical protein
MFVKLRHQSHAIFPDDPGRFVAVPVIFESVIDRNSCHPHIYTRLKRIAFRIEAQNRRMLRDSVFEQDHINVVVKVLVLLTRWFLSLQFAGRMHFAGINKVHAVLYRDGAAAISSLLQFEANRCQWGQVNDDRMFASHPLASFAVNAAEISYVAAAVGFAVGVDDLPIKSGFWHA